MKVNIGTSIIVLLLTLLNVNLTLAGWDQPISPKEYQKVIGQGFSASLFNGHYNARKNETRLHHDRLFNITMIKDIHDAGFTNLRLRCDANIEDLKNFTSDLFKAFLNNLTTVVDECLYYNVTPIVSWSNKEYLANATTTAAKKHFLGWWGKVATQLRNRDYRLSYNLITEINNAHCKDCSDSIMSNPDTYSEWMKAAIDKIRGRQGNNAERILILPSAPFTGKGLALMNDSIYGNDSHLMVEFHSYAAGPNKKTFKNGTKQGKYWEGNGTETSRNNVAMKIQYGSNYTASKGIYTYFGAWMPVDNKKGKLNQSECINFARFMIQTLGNAKIPWTLNSLFWYMSKDTKTWDTEPRNNHNNTLYMNEILAEIKDAMAPYTPYADGTNADR